MAPATSIIMPAYNAGGYIGEAIESVLAQTRGDWTLIIVNDGSADNTADIVEAFAARDPRIRLINQENGGAPVARNTALNAAQTEFISLLDADDAYAPDYIEAMIGALEAAPDLSFCCCDAFLFHKEKKPGDRCSAHTAMAAPVTLERVAARDFQVYTAGSLRRDWMTKIGGYDEKLTTSEDFDLWVRILSAGGKALYLDQPLAWYRRTPGSLSSNTVRLNRHTIDVYEKLQRSNPELSAICADNIAKAGHQIALIEAKAALREGRYDDFQENTARALAAGDNWKLSTVARIASLSGPLARLMFSWRA